MTSQMQLLVEMAEMRVNMTELPHRVREVLSNSLDSGQARERGNDHEFTLNNIFSSSLLTKIRRIASHQG